MFSMFILCRDNCQRQETLEKINHEKILRNQSKDNLMYFAGR